MNGGWPSDQQISFPPLLNQDGVEVAGCLDDWRADMLGEKTRRLRKPHTDYPEPELKAKTTEQSVKAHVQCRLWFVRQRPGGLHRTIFLCGGGPCSWRRSTYGQTLQFQDLGDYIFNYGHDGARGLQFQVHEQNLPFFSPLYLNSDTHTRRDK